MASSSSASRAAAALAAATAVPPHLRRGSNRESVASSSSRNRSYSTRGGPNSPPEREPSRASTRISSRAPSTDIRRSERIGIPSRTVSSSRRSQDGASTPRPMNRRPTTATSYQQTPVVLPWNPEARLIPSTTAPLGSRISVAPLSSALPSYKMPVPLVEMVPELQEAAILEDLLFVFMGYEGQYIRFRDDYNPANEMDRLLGPQFKISPGLDPSLRDLTTTMLVMATHYGAVEAFVEVQSREEFGVVNHALSAAIRKLLNEYLVLIGQFEHQFLTSPSFTLNLLHLHTIPTAHMLAQLYTFAKEILKKNAMLEDDDDDSMDDFDDVENIIEALREGDGAAALPGSKICRGGSVLALLTQRLSEMAGDPAARALLSLLLREASRPYMTMLNEWLHKGMIRDPHSEFLIKEAQSIRREKLEEDYTDEYWEKRYTMRQDEVPPQLEAVRDKVLLAGKYLNVVRECGGVDVSKEITDIPRTFEDPKFLDNVNSAYAHANASLLELLLTTHALPERLRSLKHYFFLDRADFFQHFLEMAHSELSKPEKKVNVSKLQSLFDLALRQPGSIAASDPFKEDVKVTMNDVDLTKWLMRVVNVSGMDENAMQIDTTTTKAGPNEDEKGITGYLALQLDYSVPFPLSLVISRKTVLRYQLLFRHLLTLRTLENHLCSAWKDHTTVFTWKHKSRYPEVERWKRRAWTLRARMLVFVQQLLYFCTMEVVEPNWAKLMKRLDEVKTVDQLMQHHVDFLDTCLKECMLTNSKLLKIHSKITLTCSMFASYTSHLSRSLIAADPELAYPAARFENGGKIQPFDPENIAKLNENLGKYEHNFGRHLKILLDALNYFAATETVVLLSLCARLQMAQSGDESQSGHAVSR